MNSRSVRLFARYAELLGGAQVEVALPPDATVADLIHALRLLPGGALLPATPFIAVDHRQVHADAALPAVGEIAVLPPMAGG